MNGFLKLDAQADIDHFLANVFMMMNFEVNELVLEADDRERMLHLLKVAHTVIAHQDLLKGKDLEQVKQEVPVNEILENALMINEDLKEKRNVKLEMDLDSFYVYGDRYYMNEAFKYLLSSLFEICNEIKITGKVKDKVLQFECDADEDLPEAFDDVLAHFLSKDLFANNDLFYQCALKIFALQGAKVEVDNDVISLDFNSDS